MFEDEIQVRLAEEGMAFIYSIRRAGVLIESTAVYPIDEVDSVLQGYYGGSEAMD